jgi:hypothetical protein
MERTLFGHVFGRVRRSDLDDERSTVYRLGQYYSCTHGVWYACSAEIDSRNPGLFRLRLSDDMQCLLMYTCTLVCRPWTRRIKNVIIDMPAAPEQESPQTFQWMQTISKVWRVSKLLERSSLGGSSNYRGGVNLFDAIGGCRLYLCVCSGNCVHWLGYKEAYRQAPLWMWCVMMSFFQVLFVIGVNLQGLFIFGFHCARLQIVRDTWKTSVISRLSSNSWSVSAAKSTRLTSASSPAINTQQHISPLSDELKRKSAATML